MITGEAPAVARRRLRLALRKAREAKRLTQGEVADELGWSLSKVNRIENGEVKISGTDLKALMELLDVTDHARRSRWTADAKASRGRSIWDEPRFREHLTPAMLKLLEFESQATTIRCFHSTLVPGMLQTPAYAETLINFWREELSDEVRATRGEVRPMRRRYLLDQVDPPDLLVVLDESVTLRNVGGRRVMADQLDELATLCSRPNIEIRIIPMDEAAALAHIPPFLLLDLGEDDQSAVVYREGFLVDEIGEGSRAERHRRIFEQMWVASLGKEQSRRLIQARSAGIRSDLDRASR
jgi:transcriptional regulator with XRE-family HTH domain